MSMEEPIKNNITNASLIRIIRRAGIVRAEHPIYEWLRGEADTFIETVMFQTKSIMKACNNCKILKIKHLEPSLNVSMFSDIISDTKCDLDKSKGVISEIQTFQKSGCLILNTKKFIHLVNSHIGDGIKISKDASFLLQHMTEKLLVNLCQNAASLAIHAGRKTVTRADLEAVYTINNQRNITMGVTSNTPTPVINDLISFEPYVNKLLDKGNLVKINQDAKSQISFIINIVGKNIVERSVDICKIDVRKIIKHTDILSASLMVLGKFGEHAERAANKNIQIFKSSNPKIVKGSTLRSGLTLPVSKILEMIKKYNYGFKLNLLAAISLTAILEFLSTEILDLSSYRTNDITARDLYLIIHQDDELKSVMNNLNVDILGGGVLPNIKPFFLRTKSNQI